MISMECVCLSGGHRLVVHRCHPQATQDETDAYREVCKDVVFVGLPTIGGHYEVPTANGETEWLESTGDYNAGPVFCWLKDIEVRSPCSRSDHFEAGFYTIIVSGVLYFRLTCLFRMCSRTADGAMIFSPRSQAVSMVLEDLANAFHTPPQDP